MIFKITILVQAEQLKSNIMTKIHLKVLKKIMQTNNL